MKVKLSKDFRFDASHTMNQLPVGHPCRQLHGHGYRVSIEIYGEVNPETGFLMDYGDLKKIVAPVIAKLDHAHLNDVEGLTYTTSEHIAAWLWREIKPKLPMLSKITVHETPSTYCEYTGD